jgi:hypothetical protein
MKVKINEFIEKRNMRPAHQAGFLAHIRMDADREVELSHLEESYRQFCGIPEDVNVAPIEPPRIPDRSGRKGRASTPASATGGEVQSEEEPE